MKALAQDAGDSGLLIQAHHALWPTVFPRGELSGALDHATTAVALYDSDRHASLAAIFGNHDPAVCALGHGAWALKLSGKPEESSRQSTRAVALARTLGHPFSEAHVLEDGFARESAALDGARCQVVLAVGRPAMLLHVAHARADSQRSRANALTPVP